MSISKFNFNLINHKDLRKFLTKKLETSKWEFSSAFEATLAHYTYNPPIAYNFVHSRNMKIIIKKIMLELGCEFILPFVHFNIKNMVKVLEENGPFFDDGLYYFKCADGKREFSNQPVKSSEEIQKIVYTKYKNSNMNFILEKSDKKMAMFDGDIFDLRVYVLTVRLEQKYYTFMYPTIFVNFPNDNKDRKTFMKSLGLNDKDDISGLVPIMKDIYHLVQKTSIVLSNYLEVTRKIFKLEKEMKNLDRKDSDMQFNLYGIDIVLSADKKPYLSDIALNPVFGLMTLSQRIIREKMRVYDDLVENFITSYDKTGKINIDKTDFVLLHRIPQEVMYRWVISKKDKFDSDDTIEYSVDGNDFVTNHGESLVQSIIMENKHTLKNNNDELTSKIGMKPLVSDSYFNTDRLIIDGLGDEYVMNNFEDLGGDPHEMTLKDKIDEMMERERKVREPKRSYLGLATKTIPIIGLLYAAKKTYANYKK